jgi:hypothetical protein
VRQYVFHQRIEVHLCAQHFGRFRLKLFYQLGVHSLFVPFLTDPQYNDIERQRHRGGTRHPFKVGQHLGNAGFNCLLHHWLPNGRNVVASWSNELWPSIFMGLLACLA